MNQLSQISMRRLVGPLLAENLLRIALSSVDIFMLSLFSDQAVAAVGLANQYAMFIMLIYSVVGTGASIVLAQTLGAGRREEAGDLGTVSLALATGFGLVMSLAMVLAASPILSLYTLEPAVRDFAWQYLVVYGAGSVFVAYNSVQSGILRTCGHPRDAMVTNIIANLLNIAGNWLAIKGLNLGPLVLPVTGVAGVAASTVFSQVAACLIFARTLKRRGEITLRFRKLPDMPRILYRRILGIGVPTAGEGLAYNIAQILLMNMAASLGTAAMSAWVYNMTYMRFVFAGAMAIAAATQIQVGHLVGAGEQRQAYHKVYRYYLVGLACSVTMVILVNLFKTPLLGLLTRDAQVIQLASQLMLVSIALEIGRASNLVVIHGLKGAGDVRFPVFTGMVSMWGIGVLGGYVMGLRLGWGVAGIWAGVAADEFLRGIIMLLRWRSRAWATKALVTRQGPAGHEPAGELPAEPVTGMGISALAPALSGTRPLLDIESVPPEPSRPGAGGCSSGGQTT